MAKVLIKTERLILREFENKKSDITDIIEGINNYNVSKWLAVVPYPYTKKDALYWINNCKKKQKQKERSGYSLAIELKSEGKLIGGISLDSVDKDQRKTSIGCWLNSKYHKEGYGSEAIKAIVSFAFNKLKLQRVEGKVFVGNPSSWKILEKLGAKREGLTRKSCICKADGKVTDEWIYGLLKEDFFATLAKK